MNTTASVVKSLKLPNESTDLTPLLLYAFIPNRDACLLMLSYCDTDWRKAVIRICSDDFALQMHREYKFMEYVFSAEQDEKLEEYKAIAMLKEHKALTQVKQPLKLQDGKTVMVTALQKTFYSLDGHLREKISQLMSSEEESKQLKEYVEECEKMKRPLFVSLARFTQKNDNVQVELNKINPENVRYLCEQYGAAQDELLHLATNFIHQICHPNESRTLAPCPDFAEEKHLPRSLTVFDFIVNRSIRLTPKSGLGSRFYVGRGSEPGAFGWHTASDAVQLESDKRALLKYEEVEIRKAHLLLVKHNIKFAEMTQDAQSDSSLVATQPRSRRPGPSSAT